MECLHCGQNNDDDAALCTVCGAGLTVVEESSSDTSATSVSYMEAYGAGSSLDSIEEVAAINEAAHEAAADSVQEQTVSTNEEAVQTGKGKRSAKGKKSEGFGIAAAGVRFLRMWSENPKKFERRNAMLRVLIKGILPFILGILAATHWDPGYYFTVNAKSVFTLYFFMTVILNTLLFYALIFVVIRFLQWRLTKNFGYARKKRYTNILNPFITLARNKIYASGDRELIDALHSYQEYCCGKRDEAASITQQRKKEANKTMLDHQQKVQEREKRNLENRIAETRDAIESTEESYRGYYKHKGGFTEDFYRNPDGFFEKDRYESLKKEEEKLKQEYEHKYGSER